MYLLAVNRAPRAVKPHTSTYMDSHIKDKSATTDVDFHKLSTDTVQGKTPLIALEEDFFKVAGQAFAVLSFIDSSQYSGLRLEGAMSQPTHLIKVRGVFSTQEAAENHVKQCQQIDTYFDYHVIETHKWSTIGASKGDEQVWGDEMMNEAMHKYFEKDNDTLANLEKRIERAQKGDEGDRSAEATKFFEDSQKCNVGGSVAPSVAAGLDMMSLEEARKLTAVPTT